MGSAAVFPALQRGGIGVAAVANLRVASLRYFDRDGHFAILARQITGLDLPEVLRAVAVTSGHGELVLAWRSPTETWLFSDDTGAFDEVARRLASATDGCMVEQTGGLVVLAVQGERTPDLLRRLGSEASIPALGEARISRLAELPVMSICLQEHMVWLIAERVYLAHLRGWIETTLSDLA